MSTEDKKWLYGRLGLDLNYDEFEETLSNDDDLQWYYDRARNMGLEVGTYDEFNELFGNPVQVQPTDSTSLLKDSPYAAQFAEETPEEKAERRAIRQIKTADKIAKIGQFMSPVSSPSTFAPTPIVKESEPKLPTPEQIVAAEDERLFKQHLEDSGHIKKLYEMRDKAREDDGSNGIWDYINPLGEKAPIGGAIHLLRSAFSEDYRDKKRAQKRNRLIAEQADKAIDVYEQATGDRNGISSVFNAIADEASRISTWDLGMTDLQNAATLYDLSQKDESELTASEKATLDAIGLASSVMDLYGDEVGIGYTLGRGIPATVSFMGSMALNPAAGYGKKLAGDAVKKFGKDYVKRVAKRVAGDILETGAYVGSVALPQVAANALDRINGSTTYDLDDDLNVVYGGQENQEALGNAIWKAFGETFIEGYTERVGDYFDPIIGFAKGVTKGIKAGKLSDFAEALVEVKPTATMQNIRRFKEKTLFNGTLSELMEEELGMIMNAYTVGDYTFDKEEAERTGKTYILDPVNQFVTGMSVGIFSAAINGTEMAANHAYKRKVNKVAEKYGKIAERELGAQFSEMIDGVPSLRERIDNADADEKNRILADIWGNPNLNDKQKAAVAQYAIYRQYAQTFNAVQANALNHKMDEVKEQHAAYEAGYSSALPAFYNIANAFKEAQQAVNDYTERTGDSSVMDAIQLIENNPSEIKNIRDGLTDEQYQLVTNYKNTLERYRGAYQGRSDKLEDYVDEYAFALEPAINADANGNRTITTAIYKDEPVYVLYNDGTHATIMKANGDRLQTDKQMLLTRDLSEIVSHDAEQYINDYRRQITGQMDAETENAFEHHPKTQAPRKDLVLQSPEGEVVITAVNDNMVEIVPAVYKDGQVQPKEGAEPQTITVDDAYMWQDSYYQGLDDAAAATASQPTVDNMSANEAENESMPTEEIEQSVSGEVADGQSEGVKAYTLSDEVDENGRQFVVAPNGSIEFGRISSETGLSEAPILLSEGIITNPQTNDGYGLVHIEARHGDQIRKAGYKSVVDFVEEVARNYEVIREGINRNGHQTYMLQLTDKHNNTLMIELSGDGTYWNINTAGIFKTSYGRNRKEVYNRHTTDKQSTETVGVSQNDEQGGTQSNSSMNTPTLQYSNTKGSGNVSGVQVNGQENAAEGANIDTSINKSAFERVPKDEKGEPIYEQTDADTAWDAIVEQAKGNEAMAQSVVNETLEDKKAALKKAQEGKPKKGKTVAEKIANYEAHQGAIAKAEQEVAHWAEIAGTLARRREAAMSTADRYAAEMEQKSISEGLQALGEPQSLQEYVLAQLAGGAYKLRWSDKENGTKGFGSHTGLSTEEMQARLSMVDNKNGLTPEEIAHSIVENMDASFGEVDVMDVTNMVIDAVSTHASRRSMLNGMVESRAELMRQQARAEQEAKDAWYMEQYHATEEELAAYNEYLAEFAEEIYGEDTDYEQRIATFAEIQLGEYDNQGTDAGLRSSADQGEGLASDREGSSSLGETEQLDRREVLGDAAGVAAPEDQGAGSSVSAQSDDRQARIDRSVAEYRENVDNSPEAEAAAERDWQEYQRDLAEDAAETVETLENGDVRRTNRNSRGEIATVAIERDGKIISVDSYDEGVLFEHTDYDENGQATKVTRYKDGEVVSEQEYKDGKRKVTYNVEDIQRTPLSELEYVKRETDRLFNEREDQSVGRKEWELTDEGVDAENAAIDSYPAYIQSLADNGELQRMYDSASVGEEIQIRRAVEAAGLELDDVVDVTAKKAQQKAKRDAKKAAKAKELMDKVLASKNTNEDETNKRQRRILRDDVREDSKIIQGRINDFSQKTKWDRGITGIWRDILEGLRKSTDEEIRTLRESAVDDNNDAFVAFLDLYGRSGERLYILSQSGIIPNQPVSLDKVEQLFMEYNEDEGLAILFDRLRPIIEQINPKITFEVIRDVDGNVKDNTVGDFYLKDNHLRFNLHSLNSSYQTDQEKASTIVHEMLHAVAQYALDAKQRINNGEAAGVELSKQILDAAQSLINIYNAVKDNPVLAEEYGIKDVHEMVSELANPEFREKLRQIDVKGKNVWERIKDAIKRFINRFADIYDTSAYRKASDALDSLMDNFDINAYGQAREFSGGVKQRIVGNTEGNLRFREKEEQEIIAKAKADGTYMKAPNGELTNLTPKQWAQVRTEAFKKWFGDWMKAARIEKLRNSTPIDVEFNGEYELNRDSAKKWMKANLRGEYTNIDTGEKVTISKVGINEVTSHGAYNEAHLISLSAIPDMIKHAIFIDELENVKGHDKFDSYRYYVCGLKIDGVDYTAKIVAGVKDGNKYYDHRLTEIEKGTLIDNLNGLSNSVAENQNADFSNGKDTKLLSILQHYSSKIVDENGEPMVVYHGTDADFTVFDKSRGRANMDIQGMFFSPWEDDARGYGSNVRAFFVNVKNPAGEREGYGALRRFQGQNGAGVKAREYLASLGYDGVNNGNEEFIAFAPNQIKSATDNVGTFDESNDDIRFRDSSPFYSNAERAVENIKQNKATPEQWLAMIKKDGGLKAGEDKWMGLSEWLEEKKSEGVKSMTKDEVLAFIRENQIEIEEVEYGDNPVGFDELKEEYEAMLRDEGYDAAHDAMVERFGDDFDIAFNDLGGELVIANEEAAAALLGSGNIINHTRLDYTTAGLENKKEIALVVPTIEPWNEGDEVHFGDAGEGRAVAWVRFGETTDEDGNRVLVIDEVQSKRHDEGRAKGYKSQADKTPAKMEDLTFGEYNGLTKVMYKGERFFFSQRMSNEEILATINERIANGQLGAANGLIPDAPFDKNYHELVMKRMLRYAAENGFDKVAWTKGAQQAERYGLSNTVSSIEYKPLSNGHYSVTAYGTNGYPIGNIPAVYNSEQEIADVFGKEMAVKIVQGVERARRSIAEYTESKEAVRAKMREVDEDSAEYEELLEKFASYYKAISEARSAQTIEGEDLQIGGDGMKGFYDEMIPRFMNKYTKKWGTKVGEVTLPNVEEAGRTMWSVDVTPEMRESVMQGQPMFREGEGAISDREVSYENDPIAKFMGKPRYYGKRAAAFAERERRRMENAANEAAKMLGLEVEVITDASTLQGRKAKAKGWYDIVNKKVVVVVPNHVSMGDAVRTVLHEGIAHHGLRELFGDGFDAMLDNVYNNVSPELKARIDAIAERTGVSARVATEEYLASLAEVTNFEEAHRRGWWQKIKQYFAKMLRKLSMPGLKLEEEITDNELRYLLWRSYKNLVEPNSRLKPLSYAEDVVKQKELKVGNYAETKQETPRAAETSEAEEMSMASEDDIRYRLVDDPAEIERLESEPTIKAYRAMQVINGELYPPMSAVVDGKLREPIALGQWEQSEERPDLADENGRFKLDKGNKKSLKAAYNPYFHSSPIPLNDQFSEAQSRDNLVTVEVEIPVSEADGTSGYKAEKAKDAVGTHQWKAGIIQGQLTGTREVFLTRWDKPMRIVPESEVADVIVEMFDGKDIVMPSNVVTPQLRKELEARGIAFVETDNQGKLVEGEHKGEHYSRVYGKKAESGLRYRDENLYTPQELAKMETPIHKSKGGFKNLAEAEVWAKENLQGKTRTNQFTGDEISIGKKSVSEMLNEKTLNQSVDVNTHLAALQSVLDFIETGIPAEVHKDTHGRDFDVMRLYNAIEVDGKVYRVKSTVRKVRQGDKYYTYEVQKMELIEERGANPNREGENPRNGNNSTNSISGAKLLKGVKKTNSNEEILPSDENIRNSEEIIAEVERESANLGVQVRIARSIDELPDADTRKRAEDGKLKGYFDPRTGEVVLYEPNTENANDAKRTILHEIVGHKGLRSLIGEQRYDKAMLQLMYMLPADVRDAVLRRAERHGWNAAIAMDEYLAGQAERDVQPTWWGKVNAKIRALLRNLGFDVKLTDADVTYLLWRSRKKLQGDDLNDMAVNAILKQAARKSAEADAWNEQAFKDAEMRDFERNTLPSIRHRMGADTNDYEKTVRTLGFKQAEAWQDHMRSLLVFQQALAKASGKKIADFENAYMYENRMSSANLMEMEQYRHMVYNPLLKAIHELEQMGASRESIINYLFAKSGLERNEVFARRDARKNAKNMFERLKDLLEKEPASDRVIEIARIVKHIGGTDIYTSVAKGQEIAWFNEHKAELLSLTGNPETVKAIENSIYEKYRTKDYSGLTALTSDNAHIKKLVDTHLEKHNEYERLKNNKRRGVEVDAAAYRKARSERNKARKEMITAIEAEAQRMVDTFEQAHNTDELWDKIRNSTHTILNISHDAGVMSDEVYKELYNQFQYYIPLRGFAEQTAEDMYLYLGGNDSPYNAPIKTAYGRTSLADDPIATIGNMAESAIVEANRNRLKQRFLYMVERHNTDLASISDVWLEYDEVNDEWHTVFAQIPDDATPSEAKRLQQEFEDRMKTLAEQNPGKYANASQQPNIPYRVVKKGDRQEHHVIVKRNGKDVVITINGNPRVAQAINGLTNPEQNNGPVQRIVNWVNRNLSANFTMRNPAFMVSNFVRDGFYTNSMVWVKENPAYARQYNKNWAICTAQIASLVKRYKRYEKGDMSALDMNNDMDRMFYEFMINGGETGYTVIKSVEDYKGLISGEMKKMEAGAMGTARRVADTIGNVVDTFGRWAEDTSRFAAYMTSRQLGRTITKSIWDAKEISVNFNKKGSGNRMMGKFEQGNRLNYVLSNMSQLGRNLYVFWNAGMQGLNNFKNAAKKSPAKFTAMAGTYFTLGVIVAAAFSGDDDEDDYYNLPEYVRRNNICFKIGKGKYATLPLPIEIRAIYGLGELAYSYLSGREGLTHGEAITKTIQQITQVLPIDMMADGGGAMALVPSAAKPVVEVIHNVDWTGRPIYKEKTSWNQNDPTWTLAFKSTSPELVEMSRLVNEWTNKNTADGLERPYNRGWADNRYLNNPAVWEHIMEGYLGGMATMFNQTKKTLMMPFNEDLREVRNVPIASRFIKDAGKEGRSYAARNEYYDAKNIMDSWKNEMSKAKKEVLDESLTDEQRLKAAKLRSSLEQQYMEAAERWKVLDRQRKALEEAYKNDQSEDNRQALDDVMMQMATLVEAYRD